MQDYRVQLEDTYAGPMDLLLYLIRRDEVDIYDIPIARLLADYLTYVRLLEALDPDAVGEFLVMAATLMEITAQGADRGGRGRFARSAGGLGAPVVGVPGIS